MSSSSLAVAQTAHVPETDVLLELARDSIRSGVERGVPARPDPLAYPAQLRELRASFVSLHLRGELRGCIGGLRPVRPLVSDVAEHAFAAAFRDPRFPPLVAAELAPLAIRISILSPLEPLCFSSEVHLLEQLRPGIDGLLLELPGRCATFLPEVWRQLPEPRAFLAQLKRKAGLVPDAWPEGIAFSRYTVESLARE
jgi:uncharacterized protein